jgi:hypothetical protein
VNDIYINKTLNFKILNIWLLFSLPLLISLLPLVSNHHSIYATLSLLQLTSKWSQAKVCSLRFLLNPQLFYKKLCLSNLQFLHSHNKKIDHYLLQTFHATLALLLACDSSQSYFQLISLMAFLCLRMPYWPRLTNLLNLESFIS